VSKTSKCEYIPTYSHSSIINICNISQGLGSTWHVKPLQNQSRLRRLPHLLLASSDLQQFLASPAQLQKTVWFHLHPSHLFHLHPSHLWDLQQFLRSPPQLLPQHYKQAQITTIISAPFDHYSKVCIWACVHLPTFSTICSNFNTEADYCIQIVIKAQTKFPIRPIS